MPEGVKKGMKKSLGSRKRKSKMKEQDSSDDDDDDDMPPLIQGPDTDDDDNGKEDDPDDDQPERPDLASSEPEPISAKASIPVDKSASDEHEDWRKEHGSPWDDSSEFYIGAKVEISGLAKNP